MKAPTPKSRFVASMAVICIIAIYVVEGWLSPPVPAAVSVPFGAAVVALMYWAKAIRENEGKEITIPIEFQSRMNKLGQLEVCFALISGTSVIIALAVMQMGAPKEIQRIVFCGSLVIFLINGVVNYISYRKFREILDLLE